MTFSRRRFMRSLSLGAAAAALPTGLRAQTAQKSPNIIYILADDLGYGDLSCYGQKKFTTPNIDRLASEGMRFNQHYTGSAVCAPSRCCLMTGLHTGHAPVRGNKEFAGGGQLPLTPDPRTLPLRLKEAGYATGMFGKWGLGIAGNAGDPLRHFDTFYGYACQRVAHNYYPDHLWRGREKVPLDGKTYAHDLIMAEAMSFIRARHDQPFFCYLPVTIPHAAMQVPAELHDKYRAQYPQFDAVIGKYDKAITPVKNPIAAFPAMMERLDTDVGRILALLGELGIDDNTVVMFSSDNGPHNEGGHDPDFWDSNGPLKGFKRDLYEGGIRTPFLVRWPGKIRPGTVADHVSAFWDVLPTCCELAGLADPRGLDGRSFLPTLKGAPQPEHDYLYWEFSEQGGKQAIRRGNLKAVKCGVTRNPQAALELYDLSNDPGETTNLAASRPEAVRELNALLAQARTESTAFPLFAPVKGG